MILQGVVGPQGTKQANGTNPTVSLGNLAEALVSELLPRYYYLAYNGYVFAASNTAAVALAASAASGAAFSLYNPIGNTKNLVLMDITTSIGAQTAATQLEAIVLAGGLTTSVPTAITALSPTSTVIGGQNQASGKASSAATFSAAGTILRTLFAVGQAATATTGVPNPLASKDSIDGAIIIPPGGWVGVFGLTGGAVADVSVVCSATWAEIPV